MPQYVVPNGFNHRILATFNLHEVHCFCQFRAAANVHLLIRKIVQRVADEMQGASVIGEVVKSHQEMWQEIDTE
jgi:hypothetical protein